MLQGKKSHHFHWDAEGTVKEMKSCNHCGRCCLSGIPCAFGQILFDITEYNPMPCPACEEENGLFWYGLIRNPQRWFKSLVGEDWKCEAMADIAGIYIGIGDGCGVSPNQKKIMAKMGQWLARRKEIVDVK